MSIKRFIDWIKEDEYTSVYAHPNHPDHDMWKHGVPALRNLHTKKVHIGKRGDTHWEMAEKHRRTLPKGEDPFEHFEPGFYHTKNREFHPRAFMGMDSTDLMSKMQRDRYVARSGG